MSRTITLVRKDDPRVRYQTSRTAFLLGRGENCEIVIADPHISRVQAKVKVEKGRYFIKNVGRNPMLVNGAPAAGRVLTNGDELKLGNISFVIQTDEAVAPAAPNPQIEERTIAVSAPVEETADCRLVISSSEGDPRVVLFDKEKLVVGRSAEADVQLNDPLISRRHCVIERRADGVYVRNISATNPMLINGQPKTESRIYSGDRLQAGAHSIVFTSNLPEDACQPHLAAPLPSRRGSRGMQVLTVLALLGFCGYFGYQSAFKPWQVGRTLSDVERQLEAGRLADAHQTLKRLLGGTLSAANAGHARELMAKTALALAEEKAAAGNVLGAKKQLNAHLAVYGSGPEAALLWDRLDYYCIGLANKLEAEGRLQQALHQFAAVREESLYLAEAQKGIRRIWLRTQHEQREKQTIAELLKEGEIHFAAKRFLTPVNQNAYAVYQAVLLLDPQHETALERIHQIKEFYRGNAESRFKNKDWAGALGYFERYRIIDPEDKVVEARIDACRQNLMTAGSSRTRSAPGGQGASKNQDTQEQEIKRLLESSGTESTWIMKYLFEEQSGETETETPW